MRIPTFASLYLLLLLNSCTATDDSIEPFDYRFDEESKVEGSSSIILLENISARRIDRDRYQLKISFEASATEVSVSVTNYIIQGVFVLDTMSDIAISAKRGPISKGEKINETIIFSNKDVARDIVTFKSVKILVRNSNGSTTTLTKLINNN